MSGFQFATSIIMEGPGMKERDKRKERLLVGRGEGCRFTHVSIIHLSICVVIVVIGGLRDKRFKS